MSLTLCLRHPIELGLDMRSVDLAKARTVADLERLRIPYGRFAVGLGDIFRISGDIGGAVTIAAGALGRRLHHLGSGWSAGELTIEGDCGDYCGFQMSGGKIIVEGDCGDYCGAEMSGGDLTIGGDCGHKAAAADGASVSGMSGGVIRILGNCGDHCGRKMRRGLVIIEGNCGKYAAAMMKGGTLVVKGRPGRAIGELLERGSIFLLAPASISGISGISGRWGWRDCGIAEPSAFFGLLGRVVKLPKKMRRYGGNAAAAGRGELFLPVPRGGNG